MKQQAEVRYEDAAHAEATRSDEEARPSFWRQLAWLMAAPFLGLAYVVFLPVIGFVMVGYVALGPLVSKVRAFWAEPSPAMGAPQFASRARAPVSPPSTRADRARRRRREGADSKPGRGANRANRAAGRPDFRPRKFLDSHHR